MSIVTKNELTTSQAQLANAHLHVTTEQADTLTQEDGLFAIATETLKEALSLKERVKDAEHIFLGIGCHPWKHLTSLEAETKNKMRELLTDTHVYVGEVGLDNSSQHRYDLPEQCRLLDQMLELWSESDSAIVLHNVRASHLLLQRQKRLRDRRVLLHQFVGSAQDALRMSEIGVCAGVNPKNLRHWIIRNHFLHFDAQQIVIESDEFMSATEFEAFTQDVLSHAEARGVALNPAGSFLKLFCQ